MLDLAAATGRHRTIGTAVVRLAEPTDLPRIAELAGAAIHPEVVEEVWALAAETTIPFLVVDADGDVAATMAVVSGTIEVDGVGLGFVQPEFVATDPVHQRRGFASALIDVLVDAAASADVPLSLVSGIEYFYRRFGYSYAVSAHRRHTLVEFPASVDGTWKCRSATPEDIVALDALQDSVQRHADVIVRSTDERWRWVMALGHYELVVAEKQGRLDAMARVYADDHGIELTETAARSVPAADAVLDHVRTAFGDGPVTVSDRPGGGAAFLDRRASMVVERESYYLRPTTRSGLMSALVPLFDQRLARSSFADVTMRVPVSFYESGLVMHIVDGVVTGLEPFQPEPGPALSHVVSIPPDRLVDLAFSDLGAAGVDERHPDVVLGDHRRLMTTLFPPVTADLLLF